MTYLNLLLSHSEGFGLNTDILETNLVNIVLLIALLIYSFADVVKSTLQNRQESISQNLDNAANKLIFANQRFKEAEEALEAVRIKAKEIKLQTISQKEKIIANEAVKFKEELLTEIESYKRLLSERKKYFDNETYFAYLKLAKDKI